MSTIAGTVTDSISIEAYLEQEWVSENRHEYYNGKVSIMGYASDNHELIVGNVVGELWAFFKETSYRVYPSNRMLHVPNGKRFYYADAIVIQGKPTFFNYKKKMQATTNPCSIVEVLSEFTAEKDRDEKWKVYRTIPSLKEYILIAQDEIYVEVFRRIIEEPTVWRNEYYNDLSQSVLIAEQALPLIEIYRDVDFGLGEAATATDVE